MKIYRITALSLALMLALTLISCGKKKSEETDTAAQDTGTLVTDTDTAADTAEDTAADTATDTAADTAAPGTSAPTETSASPEADETTKPADTTAKKPVVTYSPDDELFSTPPVLGDICSTWRVLSSKGDFIKVTFETAKWISFTCENGEFVTRHSGTIVKGGDGYIYAEGDGKKQKIYWEDAHLCFERYGQLSECTDDELLEALDASIK